MLRTHSMVLGSTLSYAAFTGVVILLLLVDLIVFNKRPHEVSTKEAAAWSIVWIALSLCFNAYLWWYGTQTGVGSKMALEFFTGYLIEKSLSVDNLFVFLVIFAYFKVPANLQHRVLFWGVLGALILRGLFIFAGTALLQRFHWIIVVFGLLLVVTGARMLVSKEDDQVEPEKNPILKLLRRFVPTTVRYHGAQFIAKEGGRTVATPLLVVLVVVETTDLIFALDSIPAIFAITLDPFIVFTSNVCAILGLRALYFLLAKMMGKFRYLKPALALVLLFIGVKMILEVDFIGLHVPITISLGVVGAMLAVGVLASLMNPEKADTTGKAEAEAGAGPKPSTKEKAAQAVAAGLPEDEGSLDLADAPAPPPDHPIDQTLNEE